tara:strand:+ start:2111 stop:2410 length:300 start_codon:yes stop_codon:yes gene_type:complete
MFKWSATGIEITYSVDKERQVVYLQGNYRNLFSFRGIIYKNETPCLRINESFGTTLISITVCVNFDSLQIEAEGEISENKKNITLSKQNRAIGDHEGGS